MRIDFMGLQAFVSIAERGSFKRAALHLNLSQTALSHRLRKLEEDLGTRLLTRTARQVSLTRAGLDLLPRARRAVEEVEASIDEARHRGVHNQTHLFLACISTIAARYLPQVTESFRTRHPDIVLHVYDGPAGQVREFVRTGKAEFGITVAGVDIWDLDVELLTRDNFVVACPATHPLAGQPFATWQDFGSQPMIRVSDPTGSWTLLEDALRGRRETPHWRYEVRQIFTALGLVAAGTGLAVLPQLSIDTDLWPGVTLVPLRSPGISRTLSVISKRGTPLSVPAEDLRQLLAQAIERSRFKAPVGEPSTERRGATSSLKREPQ